MIDQIRENDSFILSQQQENNKIKIQINGIFLNQNNSLLSVASKTGYKIFETYNFLQVSEDDDLQEVLGSLKIAIPFYDSQLIAFVGSDDNVTFPSTQFVIWDDIKKKKIGFIMLKNKENISDFKMTKQGIFIMIPNKILIFGLKNLNYIYSIDDINHIKSHRILISYDTNPCVLLNIPSTRSNQIKISKCKFIFLF